ncbi:MAG: hypothetical protein AAFV45_14865 [Pseudomonadota bacterium]
MKAFLISTAILVVVTVGAAMALGTINETSSDAFTVENNVRL